MPHDLHSLLKEVGIQSSVELQEIKVHSISCDTRDLCQGALFVGLIGENVDGGCFWRKALSKGAVAAVISINAAKIDPPEEDDLVFVSPIPVSACMGELAAVLWDKPSLKMNLIGVTGTNGKTTTTYLIEHLSSSSGVQSALFGTLVNRWPGYSQTAAHTTSFADQLQAQLAKAESSGTCLVAMEVSSHALAQQRVTGCRFSGAVFTNLTQDHLDYHKSMEQYFQVKTLLFQPPLLKGNGARAIVNIDDPWGYRLSTQLKDACWRASLDSNLIKNEHPELFLTDIKLSSNGVEGVLHSPLGEGFFNSPLIGMFNLMNLLEAVGVLLQQGFDLDKLLPAINKFPGVPGRMEQISLRGGKIKAPVILVDYAHTPDGLKNALTTLRMVTTGRIYCVFGCGGDRDKGKRPLMGAVAAQLADFVILTSDNPRTEDPQLIIKDVLTGIPTEEEVIVESDRRNAIELAVLKAAPKDVVLIAGKGHENYQILGLEKIPFDDREIARQALTLRL
ncbi:UDP-N-acetylmuramoyl-L-alanyl-D-glutamate--2,6-diaminopimelate ligase [Prochlorococcus marinus]|uniref:UDP-N-acetylmuramoyl-L-alanyl-D-glutamate--2, 6-diaminopimelate ligase n=1 Tax=Prochlorococcus marinus TaxID=1219 RepID=UPI0022B48689|nr:UDP-N-acetylmuramoyl-L-alanyl-D-glutamate--2,6-diaminopimelate ligase [Prochlorococcus marinus]